MGSMKKRPTAPPIPKVTYYIQQPTYTGSTSSGDDTTTPEPTEDEQRTKLRVENLLRHTRGRLGTVLTGFRGILTQSDSSKERKTLLGE